MSTRPSQKNRIREFARLQKQASKGDYEALYWVAHHYYYGKYVEKNLDRAYQAWQEAAVKGQNAKSMYLLGECHTYKVGVDTPDSELAEAWYQKALPQLENEAMQGDPESQFLIGHSWYYGKGRNGKTNYPQAVHWYRRGAEKDNCCAMSGLGWCYQKGVGVEVNFREAMYWYKRSTHHGWNDGQYNYAWALETGQIGVPADLEKAFYWYSVAANQGHAAAQSNLGAMYRDGRGTAVDAAEAVYWFRQAAAQGDACGWVQLGHAYRTGKGVNLDLFEAAKCFQEAVNRGADKEEGTVAKEWLDWMITDWKASAAVQDGNGRKQHEIMQALASCYKHGVGVAQDGDLAHAWESLLVAARNDDTIGTDENDRQPNCSGSRSLPLCVCCDERAADTLLVHADQATGHACCCLACANACASRKDMGCPLCRQDLDRIVWLVNGKSTVEGGPPRFVGNQQCGGETNAATECYSMCQKANPATLLNRGRVEVAIHGETGHVLCPAIDLAITSKAADGGRFHTESLCGRGPVEFVVSAFGL